MRISFAASLRTTGLLSALLLAVPAVAQQSGPDDPFRSLAPEWPTPTDRRLASGAPGPGYWQQKVDYAIRVRLDEASRSISGEETITYHNRSPHHLEYLWVQLDDNWLAPDSLDVRATTLQDLGGLRPSTLRRLVQRRAFDGSVRLRSVRHAGGELPHLVHETMMRVDLPEPLAPGASFAFSIAWELTVNPAHLADSRAGVEVFEDGHALFLLAHWYPRLAVYDDVNGWQHEQFQGQGEFALEFGDFDVRITVPDDHVVAATGTLQNAAEVLTEDQRARWERAMQPGNEDPVMIVTREEARANEATPPTGETTWHFRAENVRDFAWASSRTFLWDCLGVQLRPGGPVIAAQSLWPEEGEPLWGEYSTRAIAHALRVFSEYTFDYPYPSAVSVNGPVYGMEYPMICFNGPRPGDGGASEYDLVGVVIHEVGHNWFPMIVNSDERAWVWMDEGLDSFVESLASERWDEDFPVWFRQPFLLAMAMTDEDAQPLMTATEQTRQLGWNGYGKPAAALHVLREAVMGPELFDPAFRAYAQRWKFKRPQPADFFRTMEDVGGTDLDWFWRAWFYSTDHVDLELAELEPVDDDLLEKAGARSPHAYVATVVNHGGIVMPLWFRLRYEDGSEETRKLPVQVWRRNDEEISVVLFTEKPLAHAALDPDRITGEADPSDNALDVGGARRAGDPGKDPYAIPIED